MHVQMFPAGADGSATGRVDLELVGIVCYYGEHYSTFFYHSKDKIWMSFDDDHVSEVITPMCNIDNNNSNSKCSV